MPAVYYKYKGRPALPHQPVPGLPEASLLMRICVSLAVIAHKGDSDAQVREKSHKDLWRHIYDANDMHKIIPYHGIRDWFTDPANLIPEVLPGFLEARNLFTDVEGISQQLFLELFRDESLCPSLPAIKEEPIRELCPEVVIWPGQSILAALEVANVRPNDFYNVYSVPLQGFTAEYLILLAKLGGLGDWVALALLSHHLEISTVIEDLVSKASLERRTNFETYALGTFWSIVGDDERAVSAWQACLDLPQAQMAMASVDDNPTAAFDRLASEIPRAKVYSASSTNDLGTLQSLAKEHADNNEIKYLLAQVASRLGKNDLAAATLKELARNGCEEACGTLFDLFPNEESYEEGELVAFAERTHRGRLALARSYKRQKKISDLKKVVNEMDTIHKTRFSAVEFQGDLDHFYAELVYRVGGY